MRGEATRSAALPWAIAIVATIAALAGWLRDDATRGRGATETTASGAIDAGTTAGSEDPLGALEACAAALRLERQSAEREPTSHARATDRIAACLADPDVQARIASEIERACTGCGDGSRAARDAGERARIEAAGAFLREELAIAPEESAELTRYLCAVRDLRGMLARAAADGGVPDAYETVRREREIATTDIARILGEDRYTRLRAVGGLGVLSESADCPR